MRLWTILVARIEPAGVGAHGDEAGALLHRDHRFGIPEIVGERDLDLHVLAGLEALQRLGGVHLGRRREDERVEVLKLEGLGEVGRHVPDAVFPCGFLRLVELAPDERNDLDPVDQLDAVEMLEAESAGAGQRDFDGFGHQAPRSARACFPE